MFDELNPKFALAFGNLHLLAFIIIMGHLICIILTVFFLLELRDRGQFGMALPADQIIPTAEETFDSIIAMIKKSEEILG